MKITREQFAQLRLLCKRYQVSHQTINIKKIVTIDKRLLRRRVVITEKLKWNQKRKAMTVAISHPKRFDVLIQYLSKKRNKKPKRSWKRCVRMFRLRELKDIPLTESIFDDDVSIDDTVTNELASEKGEEEVRDQLKTQLQLLQTRKQRSFCLEENSTELPPKDSSVGTPAKETPSAISELVTKTISDEMLCKDYFNGSFAEVESDDEMPALRVTPIPKEDELGRDSLTPDLEFDDDLNKPTEAEVKTNQNLSNETNNDQKSSNETDDKKQLGFLDSLLKKIKPEKIDPAFALLDPNDSAIKNNLAENLLPSQIEVATILEPSCSIPVRVLRKRGKPKRKMGEVIKREPLDRDSVCSSPVEDTEKFFGFEEQEIPGLLPTPLVESTLTSAFVDREAAEELGIKVEAPSPNPIDKKDHEGLVCMGSKPPILAKPKRLTNVDKPRTVAEKRQLMRKKKGLKFLMMENEARIYCELAKIKNNDEDYLLTCGSKEINFQMLNSLQHEQVPFRRDAWRALSWLKTEKNRFYYKVVYVDGVKCNLLGSKGNFDGKKKFRINQSPLPKYFESPRSPCCPRFRIPKSWKINLDAPTEQDPEYEHYSPAKKLLDFDKQMSNIKPAPLSVKLRIHNSRLNEDDCLGPLELCRMPPIELEVYPKEGRPIDPKVVPYLRVILPHDKITEKWARFAVSLLRHHAEKSIKEPKFAFELPYQNNKDRFFVRRRIRPEKDLPSVKFDIDDLGEKLTFTEDIAKDDELGLEIGSILTELTNCVAIGLAEDKFIKDDPDLEYNQTETPFEPEPVAVKPVKEVTKPTGKIVRELRRLNATFITTESKPEICSRKYCEKGCVCDSLSSTFTFRNHCKKPDCMLECNCSNNQIYENDKEIKECNLTSDAVKSLREKATARLAKVEKDFTPTLLLSNNSTYLIPGSDREHTRRFKRAPKKFDDYVNTPGCEGEMPKVLPERRPVIKIKDPFEAALHQIRHCSVTLRPLIHVKTIEPWCMVHKLYKCFCKGEATEGNTFTFEDLDQVEERLDFGPSKRRMYVFEKAEEPDSKRKRTSLDTSTKSNQSISNRSLARNLSFEKSKNLPLNKSSSPAVPTPRSNRRHISRCESTSQDSDTFNQSTATQPTPLDDTTDPLDTVDDKVARRVMPVDQLYLKLRNPRLQTKMVEKIRSYEERHPELLDLLKKRLDNCEYEYIKELEREQEKEQEQSMEEKPIKIKKAENAQKMEKFKIVTQTSETPKRTRVKIESRLSEEGKVGGQLNIQISPSQSIRKSLPAVPIEPKPISQPVDIPASVVTEPDVPYSKRPIRLNITNSDEEIQAIALLKQIVNHNNVLIATGKNRIFAKKDLLYSSKLDFVKVMKKTNHLIFVIEKTPIEIANEPTFLKANPMVRPAKDCNINQIINILMAPESEEVTLLVNEYNEWSGKLRIQQLEAQKNQQDTDVDKIQPLKTVNAMLTKAMQYICSLQRGNNERLCEPMQSKLYFFRWHYMLLGFQQHLLHVWQIKMKDGKEAVIITLKDETPIIDDLVEFVNIRTLSAASPTLTLFSKMLLLKIGSERTKGLSLVLYGGATFWRVCGFINSDIDYYDKGVIARPTPDTHPNLSLKINKFFNIMKQKPIGQVERKVEQATTVLKADDSPQYTTNIQMYSADVCALKSLFLPIPSIGEHRWFMLHLAADFSDIFIPAWNSYLTYDKIAFALKLAANHKKTVRVTISEKFPEIYATPEHDNRIFFGPYRMDQNIDYILCQNFDGELITREEYQKRLNFKPREITRGSWLYLKRIPAADKDEQSKKSDEDVASNISNETTTSTAPPPFIISSVETTTDPKFMPIDDSDDDVQEVPQCDDVIDLDDDDEVPINDACMEWKQKDSISLLSSGSDSRPNSNSNSPVTTTSTEIPAKNKRRISDITDVESSYLKRAKQAATPTTSRKSIATEKLEKPEKSIKLTICKPKEGESYMVKSISIAGKESEKKTSPTAPKPVPKNDSSQSNPTTIMKLPPTSSTFNLTGKRITIPLNTLKSMKKTVTMPPDLLQKLIQTKENSGTSGNATKSQTTIKIPPQQKVTVVQKVKPAPQQKVTFDAVEIDPLASPEEKVVQTKPKQISLPLCKSLPLSISVATLTSKETPVTTTCAAKPTKVIKITGSKQPKAVESLIAGDSTIRIRKPWSGETASIVPSTSTTTVTATLSKSPTTSVPPVPKATFQIKKVVVSKPNQSKPTATTTTTVAKSSPGVKLKVSNPSSLNNLTKSQKASLNSITQPKLPPNKSLKNQTSPSTTSKTVAAITMPGTSKIGGCNLTAATPKQASVGPKSPVHKVTIADIESIISNAVSITPTTTKASPPLASPPLVDNFTQPSSSKTISKSTTTGGSSKYRVFHKTNHVNPNVAFIGVTFTTQEGQEVPETLSDEGYFISGVPVLGRIKGKKNDKGFILHMNDSADNVRTFTTGHEAAQYLNKFFRSFLYALVPENFLIQWKFETNKLIYQKYPDFKPSMIPKKLVVTRYGGFNLNQEWSAFNYLDKIDKGVHLKILCLKLVDTCFPNATILKTDSLAVLQLAREACDSLPKKEKALISDKIELKAKNMELQKTFAALKGVQIYPKTQITSILKPLTVPNLPPPTALNKEVTIIRKTVERRDSQASINEHEVTIIRKINKGHDSPQGSIKDISPRQSTSQPDTEVISLTTLPKPVKRISESAATSTTSSPPLKQPRKRKTIGDMPKEVKSQKRMNSANLEKLEMQNRILKQQKESKKDVNESQ